MKKELLILGSNGALGREVSDCLRGKGYDKVYLFGSKHSEEKPEPTTVRITIGDFSIENNVEKAFRNISPAKDTVYYLFSTIGGFAGGKKIWETPLEELDKMIDMNLKTSFLIAKYFSLLIKESHSGSLFFTAAYIGLSPETGKTAYGASKAALIHLVKTLAEEGKEIKMSVNAVAPFIIDTPANRSWMENADYSLWLKPSEVGELVHSVFNNYNFITGNIFTLKNKF
jgi:NAD(P)-dependent dehydrogenase (short-subunit alcohol dehydrogenase family)